MRHVGGPDAGRGGNLGAGHDRKLGTGQGGGPETGRGGKPGIGREGKAGVRGGWWPLAVIASAHLMAVLDTTVMFVALPSVQRGLGLTVSTRQWVVTAYTLALAGLLLLGGRLADRFGARNTLLAGVIGFACASAVGGAAVDGAMLIAARAVQGAFGAVLVSSTKSLLVNVYPGGAQRVRAIGIFTATLTAGLAVGLVVGGVLTSALSWRWCLYVNIPLSLVAIFGAPRVLPALPSRPQVRIEVASAVLASGGMVALIYGLGQAAPAGWGSGQVAGSLAAGVVLLGAFTVRQAGRPDRLLPLRVVLDRTRGWGMIALVVNALSTFGMMLILTYQLQSVMRYSALATGLALVPFGVATGLGAAFVAPWLMPRVAPRWLVSGSIAIEAAGLVPLIWLTPHSDYLPLILAATLIEGLGTGIAGPVTLNIALHGVLPSDTGAAGAATSAAGQFGSSIGAALLNTIAAAATSGYLAGRAATTTAVATAATVHGFAVAMAWGAGLLVLAAVPAALFITGFITSRRRAAT
jgi:EmrB/QacA subfamily drug resistance transporter